MDYAKWKDRVTEVLTEELAEPENWWYLSFADEVFRGGVIIKAHGITDAIMKCNALQINPHGEVMAFPMPEEIIAQVAETDRTRLLTKEDVARIWPDAKSLRELEEEETLRGQP